MKPLQKRSWEKGKEKRRREGGWSRRKVRGERQLQSRFSNKNLSSSKRRSRKKKEERSGWLTCVWPGKREEAGRRARISREEKRSRCPTFRVLFFGPSGSLETEKIEARRSSPPRLSRILLCLGEDANPISGWEMRKKERSRRASSPFHPFLLPAGQERRKGDNRGREKKSRKGTKELRGRKVGGPLFLSPQLPERLG